MYAPPVSNARSIPVRIPDSQAIAWSLVGSVVFTAVGSLWPAIESDSRFIWTLYVFVGPGLVMVFVNVKELLRYLWDAFWFRQLLRTASAIQEFRAENDHVRERNTAGDLMIQLRQLGVFAKSAVGDSSEEFAELKDYMRRWDLRGARARWPRLEA